MVVSLLARRESTDDAPSLRIVAVPQLLPSRDVSLAPAHLAKLQQLRRLSHLWDSALGVPGTRWRVGLESLVGFLPFGGDAIGMILSSYIVLQALQFGLPRPLLLRMLGNVVLDGVVGSVPILGDLFDTTWKANTRNVKLLEAHLQAPTASPPVKRGFLLLLFGGLLLLLIFMAVLGAGVVHWLLQRLHT